MKQAESGHDILRRGRTKLIFSCPSNRCCTQLTVVVAAEFGFAIHFASAIDNQTNKKTQKCIFIMIFLSESRNEGWVIGVGCTLISATLIFFLPFPLGQLGEQQSSNSVSASPQKDAFTATFYAFGLATLLLFLLVLRFRGRSLKSNSAQAKAAFHRRRLTPIGKFALLSQTERNPSNIVLFIALASKDDKGLEYDEFRQIWNEVLTKHERLRFCVSDADIFLDTGSKSIDDYVLDLPHPRNPNEFKERLNQFLTLPINVEERSLEISLSSGPIGASGAILNYDKLIHQGYKTETVSLLRIHHVICDGVSLSAIIKDCSDEKDQLNVIMCDAMQKRRTHASSICAFKRTLWFVMYYVIGSFVAISLQVWNMLTLTNPFDEFTKDEEPKESTRSVSWKFLTTVDEAKSVTKSISGQTCLNDLFVALLGSALEKQHQELQAKSSSSLSKVPSYIGVVVTVHLIGSILPGQSISNNIGAFVSAIPFDSSTRRKSSSSLLRLRKISRILRSAKQTPAPQISWFITSLISKLGIKCFAKQAIVRFNCHATAVISNVRGFPFEIHWNGVPVKALYPFIPLPPKVKIGVSVLSYDGKIFLSIVSSDERVVPDTCRFLGFMLEEYDAIKQEAFKNNANE